MTNEMALEKARALCRRCDACRGSGYVEVHQPGYTHYETDSECPAYHFREVPCTCNREDKIAAALKRAFADGIDKAFRSGYYSSATWHLATEAREEANQLESRCLLR